eukprot:344975-Pleurochrysis_carterae.AAC.2
MAHAPQVLLLCFFASRSHAVPERSRLNAFDTPRCGAAASVQEMHAYVCGAAEGAAHVRTSEAACWCRGCSVYFRRLREHGLGMATAKRSVRDFRRAHPLSHARWKGQLLARLVGKGARRLEIAARGGDVERRLQVGVDHLGRGAVCEQQRADAALSALRRHVEQRVFVLERRVDQRLVLPHKLAHEYLVALTRGHHRELRLDRALRPMLEGGRRGLDELALRLRLLVGQLTPRAKSRQAARIAARLEPTGRSVQDRDRVGGILQRLPHCQLQWAVRERCIALQHQSLPATRRHPAPGTEIDRAAVEPTKLSELMERKIAAFAREC